VVCRASASDQDRPTSISGSGDLVIVAVSGDGFSCYDAATLVRAAGRAWGRPGGQAASFAPAIPIHLSLHCPRPQEQRGSYALGSAAAGFAAPVQVGGRGALVAAVQPAGGGPPSLVLVQPDKARGSAAAAAKSLLDTQPQLRLPSALHSVHALSAGAGPVGSVAVVLADGTVAGADFEHHKLRPLALPAGLAGAVAAPAAGSGGGRTRAGGGAGAWAASGAPGRPAAAAAADGCLTVAWQAGGAGAPAALAFYGATKTHPFLEALCTCELPAPGAAARLLGLHLTPGGVAAQWSCGAASAHAFDYRGGGRAPPSGAAFSLEPLAAQLGASSGASAEAAAAAAAATPAGRKRKAAVAAAATAAGAGAGGLLLAALGDAQLLAAAVAPAPSGGGAALRYAVLDVRYGLVLSTGATGLPGAALDAATGAQLVSLGGGGGGGGRDEAQLALAAGGAVYSVTVETPRADLAGLLGRLAVGAGCSAAAAQLPRLALADDGAGAAVAGAAGHGGAAAGSGVTSTAVVLDVDDLVSRAVASQEAAAGGGEDAAASSAAARPAPAAAALPGGGDGCTPLLPAGETVAGCERDQLALAAQQLAALLNERDAAAGAAGGPPPVGFARQLEAACRALLAQLSAQATAAGHPERAAKQRRRRASAAAQQLLGRTAGALAEAGSWPLLAELLAAQPLRSLGHAPRLLPLAAAAGQLELMSAVCRAAEDVPAEALAGALRALLGNSASARAAGGAAAAAARDAHRARLRASAAAVVEAAEAAAAAGAPDAGPWLACARAAAAAVDGFSAREAALHALVALDTDAAEVQAAAAQLPPHHTLRLLRYLAKWVAKHGESPLEAAAAAAAAATAAAAAGGSGPGPATRHQRRAPAVPPELRAPAWGQVLDWLRALLDAHLAALAMMPAAAATLQELSDAVGGHAAAAARLVPLRGAAEHLIAGSALPAAATAAASSYTVELLDLRVRSR
jgi:hypothetical protein